MITNTSATTAFLPNSTSPLLQRTALWPNESLASVLERLRWINFYVHRSQLATIGRERLAALNIEDKLDQPTRLETFQQLASLTGLTLDELYAASDQRFAGEPGPLAHISEPMPWLANTLRSRLDLSRVNDHLRSREIVSFCPLCLKDAAYQRSSWIPRAAAICLEHRCLLRDRCSRCWARPTVADLVNRHCPKCKADLSRMRSVSIAQDSLGFQSQQFIQTWFNVADIPGDVLEAGHLPPQPPVVLYRLLHLLARALLHGQAEWSNLPYPLDGLANRSAATISAQKHLTSEQAYVLYRSAFAGLLDWPQGLYRMLDAYAGFDDLQTQPPPRLRYVQRVQHDWLTADWDTSPLAFVQHDLLEYVLKRALPLMPGVLNHLQNVPWFIERTGLWTEAHTAQCLDLSLADLHHFCQNGALTNCYLPHHHSPLRFKRIAVLAIQHRWVTGWSLNDVSHWLGLDIADVVHLVGLGLLPMQGKWPADVDQGVFDRDVVKSFFAQISAHLKPYPWPRSDSIPLIDAVKKVRELGVDAAILLEGVLTGRLSAYLRDAKLETFYRIYFITSTIDEFPDQLYAERGWVSGDFFAYKYGFASRLLNEWLAAGCIKPAATFEYRQYFDYQQLKEVAAKHGFVPPVARPDPRDRM